MRRLNLRFIARATTVVTGTALLAYHANRTLQMNNNKNHMYLPQYQAEENPNKTQPTVYTGNHQQCAVVIVHLKGKNLSAVKQVLSSANKVSDIVKKVLPEDDTNEPEDEFTLPTIMAGVGFSTSLWKEIAKQNKIALPDGFVEYKERKSELGNMPANDTWQVVLHVKGSTQSQCFEVVQAFVDSLPENAVEKVEDRYGWQYRDGRDLSGFLDGTENPSTTDERIDAAVIRKTGGSFLIHQVWEHDLKKLKKIGHKEQEGLVGRSKDWSTEITEKEMPLHSHVRRMRDVQFKRIPIVRQSMPFGSVGGKSGLLFIAYSKDPKTFDVMLDRMVGSGDGHADGILKFSTNIFGNYYYIPGKDEISKLKL
jgi:putative iron-dependent peroxidase